MKANRVRWFLLLLLMSADYQSPAQQSEADRKLLADLRAKAEKGDAKSQYKLGCAFSLGDFGVAKDKVEAVKWYRKAAEQNHASAQCNLGGCYVDGEGVAKDEVEAVKWYRKAAEQADAVGQFNLGCCYLNGQGVVKDEVEAVKWYRKAAEQNLALAQWNLGRCYGTGTVVAKDEVEAVKWYRKAAEQNTAFAQDALGDCYRTGQGVPKDEAEAVKWFRKAAEQTNALAQNNLGNCYAHGQGVAKDEVEAVKWYRKAAEQNLAVAQLNLGVRYAIGEGVAKDEVEAVRWYRKAAEQNNAAAQYYLGVFYASGQGVAKDEVEAVRWYRKAAEQNDANAQYSLGVCYNDGKGVVKHYSEAARWYRKAAEQNDANAQYSLGNFYANGYGVPRDYLQTYKWMNLASAQGQEYAKTDLSALEWKMTSEQIGEAQRLAREFTPGQSVESGLSISRNDAASLSPTATGTGFFITEDGFLITSEHVVKGVMEIRLVTSAGTMSAKVVKVDLANDLALLKAEGRFGALPVVASRAMKLGGTVATVGFPNIGLQGFAPKLAKGEVASLSGAQDDATYFQISAPVQPGNSGGALVDERGNVVGVVSAKLSVAAAVATSGALPENVNYAVKSSFLLGFLESVPEVSAKLKEPNTKERKFEDVVKSAEQAAVLVLVY